LDSSNESKYIDQFGKKKIFIKTVTQGCIRAADTNTSTPEHKHK